MRRISVRQLLTTAGMLGILAGISDVAEAQQTRSPAGRHFVYDQFVPPGVAGSMGAAAGTFRPFAFQPVKVLLPAEGTVTWYDQSLERPIATPGPSQVSLMVGVMYRMKISGLADYPHTEFYPSVELIDQLHPPAGQAEHFPVEIEFLPEELLWASRGRMITKVVYLEQPDRVPLRNLNGQPRVTDLAPQQNAVAEADLLGRPIAIVRLGGRTPDPNYPDPNFWGPLAPVQFIQQPVMKAQIPGTPTSGVGPSRVPRP